MAIRFCILLQDKARWFFSKLYPDHDPESFKGSTGWLTRFNLCHGIKNVQLRGEILSSDMEAVEPFIYLLKQVIESEGYSRDQILNADETGLWWQMTPSCSLNTSGIAMAANFFLKPKDWVTLMGCLNASGNFRLPLVFINKSKKPWCFKHMDMNILPVKYYAQTKSWMDCNIFGEWFHHHFVPSVKIFCSEHGIKKIAPLLLDNVPSHPLSETLLSEDGMIIR